MPADYNLMKYSTIEVQSQLASQTLEKVLSYVGFSPSVCAQDATNSVHERRGKQKLLQHVLIAAVYCFYIPRERFKSFRSDQRRKCGTTDKLEAGLCFDATLCFFFFCTYQFRASFLYAFFISSALAVRETPKISYGSSSAVSAFTSSKTRMMFRSANTQLAAPNSRIALNPFNKSPRNNTLQRHDDALAAKGLGSLFYFSCSYFM